METIDEQFNNSENSTGNPEELEEYKYIIFPIDKYEIRVKLTTTNKFVEIVEVKINKDFLSQKQKLSSMGYHDVEEFYKK